MNETSLKDVSKILHLLTLINFLNKLYCKRTYLEEGRTFLTCKMFYLPTENMMFQKAILLAGMVIHQLSARELMLSLGKTYLDLVNQS